jgi:hypothetical protein
LGTTIEKQSAACFIQNAIGMISKVVGVRRNLLFTDSTAVPSAPLPTFWGFIANTFRGVVFVIVSRLWTELTAFKEQPITGCV